MSDEPTNRELLEAVTKLATGFKDDKLRGQGISSWIPVGIAVFLQAIGLVWWFGTLNARIDTHERKSVDAKQAEDRLSTRITELDGKLREHTRVEARRIRGIERKLDLPEPPDGE